MIFYPDSISFEDMLQNALQQADEINPFPEDCKFELLPPDAETLSWLEKLMGNRAIFPSDETETEADVVTRLREHLAPYLKLAQQDPEANAYELTLAYRDFVLPYELANDFKKARVCYEEVIPLFRSLLQQKRYGFGVDDCYEFILAETCGNLGDRYMDIGRLDEAESLLLESIALYEKVIRDDEADYYYQAVGPFLPMSCGHLGILYRDTNRPEQARHFLRRGHDELVQVIERYPREASGYQDLVDQYAALLTKLDQSEPE